jgi:hypothetical protein
MGCYNLIGVATPAAANRLDAIDALFLIETVWVV